MVVYYHNKTEGFYSRLLKGKLGKKNLSAQSFYPTLTFSLEKFQKAILTEKPRSRSKIKLKGLTK